MNFPFVRAAATVPKAYRRQSPASNRCKQFFGGAHPQSHFGCPIRTRFLRTGGEEGVYRYDVLMPSSLKRYQSEGSYHFITFSCYHRLPYLDNDPARIIFENELEKLRQRHQFHLFSYVLMLNHVHLLLSEPGQHPLATTLNVLTHRARREAQVHSPQPSHTWPRRKSRRLAMKQHSEWTWNKREGATPHSSR